MIEAAAAAAAAAASHGTSKRISRRDSYIGIMINHWVHRTKGGHENNHKNTQLLH
jgi:tRNA U34 5-carboxymethylaminomethyl modifying enzyme MnmG/GidA